MGMGLPPAKARTSVARSGGCSAVCGPSGRSSSSSSCWPSSASPSRSSARRSSARPRTSSSRARSAPQLPAGVTPTRSSRAPGVGSGPARDMLSSMSLTPGQGIDFDALARILLVLIGVVRAELAVRLDAGVHHGRRHAADRVPASRRRRSRSWVVCHSRLRRQAARRPAQPRDQRHRQHRPVAPAEPDPAHHVAAHDRRGADHDAHDQPDPRGRVAARGTGVLRRDGPDHQPVAAPVRRPVGVDRRPQRACRGDAYRPRHRQGVRAAARSDRDLRGARTSASTRPASRPSSSRGSSSRR